MNKSPPWPLILWLHDIMRSRSIHIGPSCKVLWNPVFGFWNITFTISDRWADGRTDNPKTYVSPSRQRYKNNIYLMARISHWLEANFFFFKSINMIFFWSIRTNGNAHITEFVVTESYSEGSLFWRFVIPNILYS